MEKNVNLNEFNNLLMKDKHHWIFSDREVKLLAFKGCLNEKVFLFDCDSFFVEVYYIREEKKITNIKGLDLNDMIVDTYIDPMNQFYRYLAA